MYAAIDMSIFNPYHKLEYANPDADTLANLVSKRINKTLATSKKTTQAVK
jgi:hypothetical protein